MSEGASANPALRLSSTAIYVVVKSKVSIMTSEWTSNDCATERVKALLEHAGIPLELQVAEICGQFCTSHPDVNMASERIVYSTGDTEDRYREIDQRVQIYEELEIDALTNVQLIVNLLIECKHRRDVEVFTFPSKKEGLYRRFPSHSAFCGSAYFQHLVRAYKLFSHLQHTSLVLLEIKDGQTPQKVYDEHLVYNAAGALYDFILFDIAPEDSTELTYSDRLVDELHLFKEFQDYLSQKRYLWKHVLTEWISAIDEQKCNLFNQRYYGGTPPYHSISAHLPVVCVNGPIYGVEWSAPSDIRSFREIPYCLASIRKRGWPGSAYAGLMTRRPEVPTIVANADSLHLVLDIGFKWYQELREALICTPSEVRNRWPLEASLFQRVMRHYYPLEARSGYRSDYDFDV